MERSYWWTRAVKIQIATKRRRIFYFLLFFWISGFLLLESSSLIFYPSILAVSIWAVHTAGKGKTVLPLVNVSIAKLNQHFPKDLLGLLKLRSQEDGWGKCSSNWEPNYTEALYSHSSDLDCTADELETIPLPHCGFIGINLWVTGGSSYETTISLTHE